MAVDPAGQPALTAWRVLGRAAGLAWLELRPRPAAPIRSACIARISAARSWAMPLWRRRGAAAPAGPRHHPAARPAGGRHRAAAAAYAGRALRPAAGGRRHDPPHRPALLLAAPAAAQARRCGFGLGLDALRGADRGGPGRRRRLLAGREAEAAASALAEAAGREGCGCRQAAGLVREAAGLAEQAGARPAPTASAAPGPCPLLARPGAGAAGPPGLRVIRHRLRAATTSARVDPPACRHAVRYLPSRLGAAAAPASHPVFAAEAHRGGLRAPARGRAGVRQRLDPNAVPSGAR